MSLPKGAESVAQFARYVKVVKDPLTALDSLNNGTLSKEETEALQAVYPRLYDQIRDTISQEVIARKETKPLPESKAVQLGVLFGIPTLPILEPGNYQVIQASYTVQLTPPQQQGGTAAPPAQSKLNKSYATAADQLEGGEMQL
jgi:hypothetical protein